MKLFILGIGYKKAPLVLEHQARDSQKNYKDIIS